MNLLKSSILGQEFINYRKASIKSERIRFSNKIRNIGLGYVPIIIDSIDRDISIFLGESMISGSTNYNILRSQPEFLKLYNPIYNKYGRPLVYHLDNKIEDIKDEIMELFKNDNTYKNYTFTLGLEDGSFPNINEKLDNVYKNHRNKEDKILYLLVTKEKTIYDYIMSIIKYLSENLIKRLKIN